MENHVLLDIAKKSIEEKFDSSIKINKEQLLKDFPFLAQNGATFVTLTLNNQLRGCIGSLQAHRQLLDDLISNAFAAAFEDPRFYELTLDEFKKVKIEISILSTPVEVIYTDIEDLKSKIKPNIHGVILQKDGRKSTFLPQVWEQLPSFEEFFSHLCYKGSFEPNCLEFHPHVFTYEVNKIK
ncbi:AmmeMemoRadiSam system protein A [Arcobacter venerupis]|uniref:AmmeMemoRadiSam system protein A n=1 Tax=Arcobacter venerupis TaxID=1054033 RepID=A0AAE7B6T1_9BACT|nr:AmmeMemoRadiSam system protein A [Arcobacter venerupis]QKF66344.1 AmmeMemoRadiSam system protein A [Arcobacter venerupis]RWS50876.1 AmmeMemoRadiSam system protein A [Arcobacter venerupis]